MASNDTSGSAVAMRFAERMHQIHESGVRELFDKGQQIPGSIDLSIGQADFDVPDPVKEATIGALDENCGRYSASQGFPELVDATRLHLQAGPGLPDDDALMITSGASGAINLALLALAGPGDEVLLPDPYFVIYKSLVDIVGATPVFYDLYPDFQLRAGEIEKRITDRTRAVILNSPGNPTGCTHDPGEIEAVADICGAARIPVISDELYDIFVYDGSHTSIKHFGGCNSLLVGGFSKAYGMAGWRLGWAAGPPRLIDKMRTLQQFIYVCPPTLVQRGGLAAFAVDLSANVAAYRRKRDIICDGLTAAGYEFSRPRGAFFVYPRVPSGDDLQFCERALEQKLIVVPGRAFSRRTTHFRISFAVSDETLERGIEVLKRLV
ncbi:MAG: aminotransferase class I/II-fold pyridoxal phosphate-dependent enzyme [bacterium]|nr:aminotransferase class I/II-fold pyridoxal phosphate-dependent enzyme [bacterium]